MQARPTCFAIKALVADPAAPQWRFDAAKTMYGGKSVGVGDPIFVFASETAGGIGLIARGTVRECVPVARTAALRQTPRVSILVERTATASARCGRRELRGFRGGDADAAGTELEFKLYRQATDKIVGLSVAAGQFLAGHFDLA